LRRPYNESLGVVMNERIAVTLTNQPDLERVSAGGVLIDVALVLTAAADRGLLRWSL
jgi:hypothetical protein